jgi:hypothetical protein
VSLPVGGACDGRAEVHVGFAEAGGLPVDGIVRSRSYGSTRSIAQETSCAARLPSLQGDASVPPEKRTEGYLDMHFELVFPHGSR